MGTRNDALEVYPNRPAPVVVVSDGQRIVRQDKLWAFRHLGKALVTGQPEEPPAARLARPATSLRRAGESLRRARQEHAQGWCGLALVCARRQAALCLCRDLAALERLPTPLNSDPDASTWILLHWCELEAA
jgi:hypothetical protein